MARRRGGAAAGPDVRAALAAYLAGRVEHYAATGGLRRAAATGGATTYPGVGWAAALRARRAVTLPAVYVSGACRAAGVPSPLPPGSCSAWVTVSPGGAVLL